MRSRAEDLWLDQAAICGAGHGRCSRLDEGGLAVREAENVANYVARRRAARYRAGLYAAADPADRGMAHSCLSPLCSVPDAATRWNITLARGSALAATIPFRCITSPGLPTARIPGPLPVTEKVGREILVFLFATMSDDQVDRVIAAVRVFPWAATVEDAHIDASCATRGGADGGGPAHLPFAVARLFYVSVCRRACHAPGHAHYHAGT